MADLTLTATDILQGSGATTSSALAGVAITAGQVAYLDSATGTLKLADSNASAATATALGIALNAAGVGQPVVYQTSGEIALGVVLTAGKIYVVSANAGLIAPSADLASGWYTTILGVAKSTSVLTLRPYVSGIAN